jgi:hypothetical protein
MMTITDRNRFERNPGSCLGGGFGHRPAYKHPGEFLGRLWALFGPPGHVGDGGFDYAVRDRVSGLAFNAYSGASGPAYGVNPADRAAIAPVLDAFDRLLDLTTPADCAVEYESEECGPYRVGSLGGRAFEGPLPADLVRLIRTIDEAQHHAPSDNPWTTMGDLGRLDSVWRLTPPGQRVAIEARACATAAALLEATMEAAARLADRPATTPFRESFAEAGLDELRTLADSPLLDSSDLGRRSRLRQFAALEARFRS